MKVTTHKEVKVKYIQMFNGIRFTVGKNGYYSSRTVKLAKGQTQRSLHRYVWEFHNGPIPPGHHVHHIDGDRTNNQIENLEILRKNIHLSGHMTPERRERQKKIIAANREKINATKRDPERQGLRRQAALKAWETRRERAATVREENRDISTR